MGELLQLQDRHPMYEDHHGSQPMGNKNPVNTTNNNPNQHSKYSNYIFYKCTNLIKEENCHALRLFRPTVFFACQKSLISSKTRYK
jgi:hypothetical protein